MPWPRLYLAESVMIKQGRSLVVIRTDCCRAIFPHLVQLLGKTGGEEVANSLGQGCCSESRARPVSLRPTHDGPVLLLHGVY